MCRHKQVLLESYEQRFEQTSRIFSEYSRRLHTYVEHAREAQRGKTAGLPDPGLELTHGPMKGGQLANQILIETPRERAIRQACESLAENLVEKIRTTFPAYDGGGSHPDPQLEVAKLGFEIDGDGISEEVRDTALTLLKTPPLLLQAMAAYTSRIVAVVARETEEIDIRADAERLRFDFKDYCLAWSLLILFFLWQIFLIELRRMEVY